MRWLGLSIVSLLFACGDKAAGSSATAERRGAPPPEVHSTASSAACVPAKLADPVSSKVFPPMAGALCLNDKTQLFGEGARSIKDICDLYDGECEVYFGLHVDRVIQSRYVGSAGAGKTIEINLSRYATAEEAYAMFTKRTVGNGDPADPAAPRPIEVQGIAALGQGNAYVWRDRWLAEITYVDRSPDATEDMVRKAGEELLPPLAKSIAGGLEGKTEPAAAVALLPTADRLPLGVRYLVDRIFEKTTGPGAFGYHRTSDGHRYRTLAMVASDAEHAQTLLDLLAPAAPELKGIGDRGRAVKETEGRLELGWVIAQKGPNLFAVGDESRVHRVGMPAAEAAKLDLSEKDKVELLKQIVR